MNNRSYFPRLIYALIIVNAAGFVLKYFELPAFIIILGFRLHLSAVIPFLFIADITGSERIKKTFIDPDYKKNYAYVIPLIIMPLFLYLAGYILGYIDLGDPEYFYEFGLSSIVDLPIYLVWNAPQLILLYFFLTMFADRKGSFFIILFTTFFLFAFEFIPSDGSLPDITGVIMLLIISMVISLLVRRFRNVYWFTIFIFIMLWQIILLAGSQSPSLIKILFAAQYNSWEGLLEINKNIREYFLPAYIAVVSTTLFVITILTKKEKIIS